MKLKTLNNWSMQWTGRHGRDGDSLCPSLQIEHVYNQVPAEYFIDTENVTVEWMWTGKGTRT